jgi:hypothetical protein
MLSDQCFPSDKFQLLHILHYNFPHSPARSFQSYIHFSFIYFFAKVPLFYANHEKPAIPIKHVINTQNYNVDHKLSQDIAGETRKIKKNSII